MLYWISEAFQSSRISQRALWASHGISGGFEDAPGGFRGVPEIFKRFYRVSGAFHRVSGSFRESSGNSGVPEDVREFQV